MTDNSLRSFILEIIQRYPLTQTEDVFKALFQSVFGCEHLVKAEPSVMQRIIDELPEAQKDTSEENVEFLGRDYCRAHLKVISEEGLKEETLSRLFVSSAVPHDTGADDILSEKIDVFLSMITDRSVPFDISDARLKAAEWRNAGYPAIHHSDIFREAYHPSYRVLKASYGLFMPVFTAIDKLSMSRNKVLIGIEGGSATGKTSLAAMLKEIYSCNVFHTDDYFLPEERRTPERLNETGGNMDRERFAAEIIRPLEENRPFKYTPYDCMTNQLMDPVNSEPKKINVVEGAYCMHPEMKAEYDLRIFLKLDEDMAKERITRRNPPEMREKFFNTWMPMEQKYFNGFGIEESCDIVLDTYRLG